MPIEIHISVPFETVSKGDTEQYLDRVMGSLGYIKAGVNGVSVKPEKGKVDEPIETGVAETSTTAEVDDTAADVDTREVGKASGGKSRRNKDEIAEDDELLKIAEQVNVNADMLNKVIASHGRAVAKTELQKRLDATPEAEAEAEADAADEAAEVEDTRKGAEPTIDDLRAMMMDYQREYGVPAITADGAMIFADALGAPEEGGAWKVSLVAQAGPEMIAKAVVAWEAALSAGKRYDAA